MRPFYFGDSARPLYGAYEAAAGGRGGRGAVLLCYPFGAEYLRSHRAFRELAHRLSEAGIHALRFDYYGCGDSAGDSDQGTVEQWIDDIGSAFEELRESTGVARPSILGLRFGATLAALAASRGLAVDQLLLWAPIVDGRRYLDELSERHAALITSRPRPAGYTMDDPPSEALGTPLPATLRQGLAGIDLAALPSCSARRVMLLGNAGSGEIAPLRGRLEELGVPVEHSSLDLTPVWLKQDQLDRTLVPRQVIDIAVKWLGDSQP